MFLVDCDSVCPFLKEIGSSELSWKDREAVELFGREYHCASIFRDKTEEVFNFAREYFHQLERAAFNGMQPASPCYSDYGRLRGYIVELFAFLRNAISGASNYPERPAVDQIKKCFHSFRLLIGRIDKLPDYIVHNCTSDRGNQSPLASYHIYHLYLELFWLHFNIAMIFASESELLLDSELNHSDSGYDPAIEKEIEWFLYNFMTLSNKMYNKGTSYVFPCNCTRQIWSAFMMKIKQQSDDNKCLDFWRYFNSVIKKFVLSSPPNESDACDLYRMEAIKSARPFEFPLCFLFKIANLRQITEGFATSNFDLFEITVKNITSNEQTISEPSLRSMMLNVVKISNLWPETKPEVILHLWEYFHKRLNCAFTIPGSEETSTFFQNSSVIEIISILKSKISSPADIKSENSFMIFLTLLGSIIKRGLMHNNPTICQKIKGRVFPKFIPSKIGALNEYGLKHFSMIFLTMTIATDNNEMCLKLQDMISQLSFNDLTLSKKAVIVKTHLIVLYLNVDSGKSIAGLVTPFKNILTKYSNSRDLESMQIIKICMKGCLDVIDSSIDFNNDEYLLIDSWITQYLTVCVSSDLYNPLEQLMSIISKLHVYCSHQIEYTESLSNMVKAMFQHVFKCVKSLYANGVAALQLADLAFTFMKFIIDGNIENETFESAMMDFVNTETPNERVVRHFLRQLLQDGSIMQSLENDNRHCQTLFIRCWVKCSLLSLELKLDERTDLLSLISQLQEFSQFQVHSGEYEQLSLSAFFWNIRQSWNLIQDDTEKSNFKRMVNQYIVGIDKCIVKAMKAPTSQQYITQIYAVASCIFVMLSPILYTRGDPSCMLHILINTLVLPPQLYMEKKLHPYIIAAMCQTWNFFITGLHELDFKNDPYVEKVMRDMINQYVPFFVEKSKTSNDAYDVRFKMFNKNPSKNYDIENYVLEKIAANFITCRGKQCHAYSTKALAIIYSMCETTDVELLERIIEHTLPAVFEQYMFSDVTTPNRKLSVQIVTALSQVRKIEDGEIDLRQSMKESLLKTCQKHLAFSSNAFFKLVMNVSPILGVAHMRHFIIALKYEVQRVEYMRGVGCDQGLRNSLRDIEASLSDEDV